MTPWVKLYVLSWWLHRWWSSDSIISQNSFYHGSVGNSWPPLPHGPVVSQSIWSLVSLNLKLSQCDLPRPPSLGSMRLLLLWNHVDWVWNVSLQINSSLGLSQFKDTSSASSSYSINSCYRASLHSRFKHWHQQYTCWFLLNNNHYYEHKGSKGKITKGG